MPVARSGGQNGAGFLGAVALRGTSGFASCRGATTTVLNPGQRSPARSDDRFGAGHFPTPARSARAHECTARSYPARGPRAMALLRTTSRRVRRAASARPDPRRGSSRLQSPSTQCPLRTRSVMGGALMGLRGRAAADVPRVVEWKGRGGCAPKGTGGARPRGPGNAAGRPDRVFPHGVYRERNGGREAGVPTLMGQGHRPPGRRRRHDVRSRVVRGSRLSYSCGGRRAPDTVEAQLQAQRRPVLYLGAATLTSVTDPLGARACLSFPAAIEETAAGI